MYMFVLPLCFIYIVLISYDNDDNFLLLSDVCTKYQEASKIVNLALTGLVSQCVAGAKIIDLCQFGTAVLEGQLAKLYNKKVDGATVEKGVAFPVCISVNEVICNHSPLSSEELVRTIHRWMSTGCFLFFICLFVPSPSPPLCWSLQAGNDRMLFPHCLRAFRGG